MQLHDFHPLYFPVLKKWIMLKLGVQILTATQGGPKIFNPVQKPESLS
jgi:uncharacterized protein YpbB